MTVPQRRFRSALFCAGMAVAVAGLPAAHATSHQPKREAVVVTALAFDGASHTLLKATAGAIYRSADEGRSWTSRNAGLPDLEVVALAAHADLPDTVFAYVAARDA